MPHCFIGLSKPRLLCPGPCSWPWGVSTDQAPTTWALTTRDQANESPRGSRKGLEHTGAWVCQVAAAHPAPGLPGLTPRLSVSAEKHFLRRSRSGDVLAKNPVVRSKSYNTPLLNPVAEHEAEGAAAGGPGIRRHSVSEMTSCPEPQGFSDSPGQGPAGAFRPSPVPQSGPCPSRLYPPSQPPEPGPGAAHGSPPSSSPENLVDQILESVDSDSEGIFIDFGRARGSGASEFEGAGGRQSIV